MFGSWRVNSSMSDPTLLRDSPSVHKACNNCRAKKVKCTGQLLGCERCEALDIQCTYLTDRERRRRTSIEDRAKKTKQSRRPPRQSESRKSSPPAARANPSPADSNNSNSMSLSSQKPNFYDVTESLSVLVEHGSEPLSTLLDETDGESAFTADMEHWPMFPVFTGDVEHWPLFPVDDASLDGQPTTDESIYASAPSTSHPSDLVFWNDLTSTDSGGENGTGFGGRATPASTANSVRSQPQAQNHTPLQIHAPTPTQGGEQMEGTEQSACRCMQRIVFLINELETRLNSDDEDGGLLHTAQNLDSALGLHKEAVRYGESMRQCRQCLSKSEKRMLLLLLANRLVVLCAHMVSASRNLVQPPSGPGADPFDLAISITVGEYEVDSAFEVGTVLRELIAFQLRALYSFITSLANTHEPQGAEFAAAKNKVIALILRMQQSSTQSLPESTHTSPL